MASGDAGFRFDRYFPEIPIFDWRSLEIPVPSDLEVMQRLVGSVLHACVIRHRVSSGGRAGVIPGLPNHGHELKSPSREKARRVVAV